MAVAGLIFSNIHDENLYMRDYIFDEGRLKEIHFNKIQKQQNNLWDWVPQYPILSHT